MTARNDAAPRPGMRKKGMVPERGSSESHVLRYVDRDYDLILYDPKAAALAKRILEAAESISTWGDLRRLQTTASAEIVDPIVDHLWDQWDGGDGAWQFDLAEEYPDLSTTVKGVDAFLSVFPDEQPLEVRTNDDDGPTFMDPFDPVVMGVPEPLHRFYVEHSTMVSSWSSPSSEDLDEIRQVVEELGWNFEEGDVNELPHY